MTNTIKGRLLGNRVMIKQNQADAEVDGIVLSEESRLKKSSGTVIQIGADVKEVKVDDTIIYDKYEGTEFTKDGDTFIIIREPSVILIND